MFVCRSTDGLVESTSTGTDGRYLAVRQAAEPFSLKTRMSAALVSTAFLAAQLTTASMVRIGLGVRSRRKSKSCGGGKEGPLDGRVMHF